MTRADRRFGPGCQSMLHTAAKRHAHLGRILAYLHLNVRPGRTLWQRSPFTLLP